MNADDFRIEVTEGRGFLRVTAMGEYTRPRLERLLERVVAETRSRGIWRVLVDVTGVPGSIPTLVRYEAGIAAARELGGKTKVAVLERPERNERFFETVARNRGASTMDFTDESAALEWLMGAGG